MPRMQPFGPLEASNEYEDMETNMRAADEQFRQWATENRPNLLRTATLLSAGDRHIAEDVVQVTLTKIYLSWDRFRRTEQQPAYARRVLVNAFTDEMRATRRKVEDLRAELPERAAPAPDRDTAELLYSALRELPAGMRSMVVLRYFHDLSVAETARAMRCTQGTVKSQTARAMTKLRVTLGATLREIDPEGHVSAAVTRIKLGAPPEAALAVPYTTVTFNRSIL